MKKTIAFILVLAMALSLSAAAFAVEVGKNERERAIEVLIASGWSEAEIEDLISEEALLEFSNCLPAVSTSKKFFKVSTDERGESVVTEVSEQECVYGAMEVQMARNEEEQVSLSQQENGISPQGSEIVKSEVTTSDGYFTYFVQAYPSATESGIYTLSARYEWLVTPSKTAIDIFSLGHSVHFNQLGDQDDVYYVYKADVYYVSNGTKLLFENYETEEPTTICVGGGGTAVSQDLYDDKTGINYSYKAENHRGYIQYKVETDETSGSGSIFAEYYHQTAVITASPSLSFPWGFGVSFTYSSKFEAISPNVYTSVSFS